MSDDFFDDKVKLHNLDREARWHRNSYFEKLAILDGGTVALVVTAMLGPLHGSVGHKTLVRGGLAFLIVALLALLLRNLVASEMEFYIAARTAGQEIRHPKVLDRVSLLNRWALICERIGIALSAAGILALGVAACLIVK